MPYFGGAHKSITGTFTFFHQEVQKMLGLSISCEFRKQHKMSVFLSGNFMPAQRSIVNSHCLLDVEKCNSI
jgi:hypothetical protein